MKTRERLEAENKVLLEALKETVAFIKVMPHSSPCVSFGGFYCGQHGLLDKYAPGWRGRPPAAAPTLENDQ